ncbi:MAG: hypothetical protein KY432_02335 [Acidobacteria bacterium]|nr:hypothetical protein [Acidobacteriota bacterium]
MRIGAIVLFWLCLCGFSSPFVDYEAGFSPSTTSSVEKQTITITADGNELTVPDGKD